MTIYVMKMILTFYLENAFQDISKYQQILTLMILNDQNLNPTLIMIVMIMIVIIQYIIDCMNCMKFLKTILVLYWNYFKMQLLQVQFIITDFYEYSYGW